MIDIVGVIGGVIDGVTLGNAEVDALGVAVKVTLGVSDTEGVILGVIEMVGVMLGVIEILGVILILTETLGVLVGVIDIEGVLDILTEGVTVGLKPGVTVTLGVGLGGGIRG